VAVAGRSHAAQMGAAVAANAYLGRMEKESIATMRVWGRTKSVPKTASQLLIAPGGCDRGVPFVITRLSPYYESVTTKT
jgi:hypothetical protein